MRAAGRMRATVTRDGEEVTARIVKVTKVFKLSAIAPVFAPTRNLLEPASTCVGWPMLQRLSRPPVDLGRLSGNRRSRSLDAIIGVIDSAPCAFAPLRQSGQHEAGAVSVATVTLADAPAPESPAPEVPAVTRSSSTTPRVGCTVRQRKRTRKHRAALRAAGFGPWLTTSAFSPMSAPLIPPGRVCYVHEIERQFPRPRPSWSLESPFTPTCSGRR